MSERLKRWPLSVLRALDRLGNALALGDDEQFISSRAWLAKQKGHHWGIVAVAIIDGVARLFGQTDHCRKSAEAQGLS